MNKGDLIIWLRSDSEELDPLCPALIVTEPIVTNWDTARAMFCLCSDGVVRSIVRQTVDFTVISRREECSIDAM